MRVAQRADLNKEPEDIAGMFDDVARRYDLMNDLLTFGQVRLWRRAMLHAIAPSPGELILDLAAGTGTSSLPLANAGAVLFPTDLSLGMLRQGHRMHPGLHFVAGDGLQLPYRDDSFDVVTISYGLRNVHDTTAALREMLRVTKPGGRLLIAEFSRPTWTPFRAAYTWYLGNVIPRFQRASSNALAYDYLAESILAWHDQPALGAMMLDAGWVDVVWKNLTGGIVAIHRGWAPK
ncbi:ubiquinone/menaquinone biosynthesis methyltransferase [Propionibacterium sp. oral taxon 192 str. F0372]|uniref:demethylmenaquinone methyltransferase n=1 Tax=Propionibacterium sp. oral taxon 192 TaxID=671222 RepID=UPI000352EC05|nr:demethylmenaquinone methyltransferase [Propionibacterium sp. oral taxon 192]EPH07208.1 ubiquinone/menaquinone biosynthesis methyltransferase [Propionibacterium sp. oral taxon 192 str. F0372]